jgi:hypothetical protein
MELTWEKIKNKGLWMGASDSYRAKVPGGWLVLTPQGAIAFFPDSAHQWDGNSLR